MEELNRKSLDVMAVTKEEIRAALYVLEDLEAANSRLEKEALLRKASKNEVLRTLVSMAIGPDRYNIKLSDIRAKSTSDKKITVLYRKFLRLAESLKNRKWGRNESLRRVNSFMTSLHPAPCKWFVRVLNKNLRVGVSEKTIRTVWGSDNMSIGNDDAIVFYKDKCPLAEKLGDLEKKSSWSGIDYGRDGWYSEPKLDGDRGLIFCFPEESRVTVLTRGGKRWHHIEKCKPFVKSALTVHKKMAAHSGFSEHLAMFYDGEFISRDGSWNETASIVRSRVNFDEEEFLSRIHVVLWDWCPLRFFNAGEFTLELAERKYTLLKAAGALRHSDRFTRISDQFYVVGHTIVHSDEQMQKTYARHLANGFEGSMLKDPNAFMVMKRTNSTIKVKPEDSATGIVVGIKPGKGKHSAAKNHHYTLVKKEMRRIGEVVDDGAFLHCRCSEKAARKLVEFLQNLVKDSNDRRVSQTNDGVAYRYSARLGYFIVKTEEGDLIRVGGKIKFDKLLEYWRDREKLIGLKIDYKYQGGSVAKARFNKFDRLRPDL